jgi:hypothetical protein
MNKPALASRKEEKRKAPCGAFTKEVEAETINLYHCFSRNEVTSITKIRNSLPYVMKPAMMVQQYGDILIVKSYNLNFSY